MTSTISSNVSTQVVLGQGGYGVMLTIADGGSVAPSADGEAAIIASGAGVYLLIQQGGSVLGGTGISGGYGAAGIDLGSGAMLVNQGMVQGGAGGSGGGAGGAGVDISSAGSLTNSGTITGGIGYGANGAGGVGIYLDGGLLTNSGLVSGQSGSGGGASGAALLLDSGTATNTGTLAGGNSATHSVAAVNLNGGTLVNAGLIEAGTGPYADAVYFHGDATLVLEPGATFDGAVVADPAFDDVLELTGLSAGTLSGLGSQFTGFTSFIVDSHATWILAGANSLAGTATIAGYLIVDATLTITGTFTLDSGGGGITGPDPSLGSVSIAGGTATNFGQWIGGSGTSVSQLGGTGTAGGTAVVLDGGSLFNDGLLRGGGGGTGGGRSGSASGGTGGAGVEMLAGTLTNAAGAIIFGGNGSSAGGHGGNGGSGGAGAYIDGGTLIDAGNIIGAGGGSSSSGILAPGGDAVQFGDSSAATLVIDPGASFGAAGGTFGNLVVASTVVADTLVLGGTSQATLDGIGTLFENFSTLNFGTGSSWTVAGTAAGLSAIAAITGFTAADSIVIDNVVEDGFAYANNELTIDEAGGSVTLNVGGGYTQSDFVVTTDGTNTTIDVLCYLRGTRILTPTGEIPVEDLRIGDRVVTRFGGIQPIRWIGRQSYDTRFVRKNPAKMPVRIEAGALGEGLPARPLSVSPGHSMLVDGTLVLASALVNGVTITQAGADAQGVLEYFQPELAGHDCIIAEGTWSETFADGPGLRAAFHNAADFWALYPEYRTPEAIALCAPRPLRGAGLDAALRPVVALAAEGLAPGPLRGSIDRVTETEIDGWAWDSSRPALPVLIEVVLDGTVLHSALACDFRADLRDAGMGGGRCAFFLALPAPLPAALLHRLTIRRAADLVPLPMSERCRAEASPRRPMMASA